MQSSIALFEALDVDDLVERHPFWFSMITIYTMTMNTNIAQLCICCIQYNRIVIYTYFMFTLSKYF